MPQSRRSFPSRPAWPRDPWRDAGIEPTLSEMLADPTVQAVMRRDGVTPAQLWAQVERARHRIPRQPLGDAPCRRCA